MVFLPTLGLSATIPDSVRVVIDLVFREYPMGQRVYGFFMTIGPEVVTAVSALVLLAAFGFQYIGDLAPCDLCWWQRYAHMAAIPLGLLAIWLDKPGRRDWAMVALFAMSLALLAGAATAFYHMGIEQKWWSGSWACTAVALQGSLEEQVKDLFARPLVRCDEIPWSLYGISMTGYNAMLSLGLGLWAGLGAFWRRNQP